MLLLEDSYYFDIFNIIFSTTFSPSALREVRCGKCTGAGWFPFNLLHRGHKDRKTEDPKTQRLQLHLVDAAWFLRARYESWLP